jgi:DNA-directed RNA polymerase II subunit RPB2
MDNSFTWNIIQSFFQDDPQCLVRHHIESYNDFFTSGIYKIFKEKNPIRLQTNYDENLFKYDDTLQKLNPDLGLGEYRRQALLYFGGKDGSRVYFGKPVIYDDDRAHYMYPNEARLRNMTYGMTIHYDIEIEYINILNTGESPEIVLGGEAASSLEYTGGDFSDSDDGNDVDGGDLLTFKSANEVADAVADAAANANAISGGAPKPVKQTVRKQRATTAAKIVRDKTPAEIAKIRELTTKSMVSENIQKTTSTLEKVYLGKFPIMVQSDFCILGGLTKDVRFQMGECRNDIGGYFIIDGKEKVVIPQEKFADNMLYIRKDTNDLYLYSAEIRSVSENVSKPIRTLSVKILAPTPSYSNLNIVVNIPNVRKPVPLFIVFRALGILSDKDIITMCLYDLDKYSGMLDTFIPSVHESGGIMTQETALDFIAVLTKEKTTAMVLYILSDYFLPHIGETNFIQKAYYLGHIVRKLLNVYMGIENETNRDNFKFKRIETPGSLISDLFREYYNLQQKAVHLSLESTLYYNQQEYENNLAKLIQDKRSVFEDKDHRQVDSGFKKAFKGNWGAKTHTKRIGVVQDMNRLSHNTMLSHLRKTNLPLDSSVKLVGPRVLHASQWGYFDPIDTPDGANIGLHKHLSISSYITKGYSREPLIKWLREKVKLKFVEECPIVLLAQYTKVFVNGFWAGMVEDPVQCTYYMKLFRRNALLPIYTSVSFDIKQNTIFIYTDEGRLTRPIFYRDNATATDAVAATAASAVASATADAASAVGFFFASEKNAIRRQIESGDFTWQQLITGFNEKKATAEFHPKKLKIYELYDLYEGVDKEINPAKLDRFLTKKAVIDYVDTSESEDIYIAVNKEVLQQTSEKYTHMEIHESLLFGMMCNLIPFPHHNPATRNSFSCGQSKQAVSMYHTNFPVRMDKSAVVLASPQIPLIKTRYMDVINGEENCYGENAIVAIMCYTGYNVEDAVLINEGSLKRGLLRTTYYSTYETHEEKTKNSRDVLETETLFTNIEKSENIIGTKPGFEYNYLDENGIIKEGTELHDKMVVIGMSSLVDPKSALRVDASKVPKKGQLGIVDKTFITEGEEGERIAKVRVREIRIPAIGDKMASRAGQKGTIGNIIPESNMPFTRDGLRPDIIINPHAIPSRMTIGQFVECITGKACSILGCFGDATAFSTMKAGELSDVLVRSGYHSSGNDVLYNGMTGEQLEAEIFMGPTYYMRLKHMVKDKINYRARGPMTSLTKQPVSGRSNNGGLRIGEMERDSIIAHGATNFLTESMMERGDKYYMAVCNQTGMLAIYHPEQNLFLSPMADGPIQFVGSVAEENMAVENITKHGRSFSVVRIPYTFKLLMQEMMCANVAMRILTDDNIEQIENLSFSSGAESTAIVENIRTMLRGENRDKERNLVKKLLAETSPDANATAAIAAAPMIDEFGRFIPTSPNTPPPPEMFAPRSPSGTPPPLSPVYTTDTPLQLSPYDESLGEYPSPEYATTEPAVMGGGGGGGYQQGALVCRRGVTPTETNNLWQVKNAGPEFTTIIRYGGSGSISGAFGGEEILVVDNNEIFPYQGHSAQTYPQYPQYPSDPFLTENLLAREQPMVNPYKQPDINLTVISGNNNKVDGVPVSSGTNSSQSPMHGGSNTISTVNESVSHSEPAKKENIPATADKKGGGVLDFLTGGFLIKKTG